MTGQARAAASRRRAGDGFVTIRSAPTLIVSVPPAARAWLRLSTMSAKAFARRHSRARLSARACSRGTSCPASVRTEAARSGSHQRQLHIDQHPAAAEDRERPGPVEDHDLQLAERSEEHTSELQSLAYLVCRLLLEKKKNTPESKQLAYLVCRLPLEQRDRSRSGIEQPAGIPRRSPRPCMSLSQNPLPPSESATSGR